VNDTAVAAQRSRGMRDLLPEEMARVRAVEDAFVQTCRAWGYSEIRTPAIEPLHLFTAAGTLSPQTLDRVYSFLDWDGWTGERVVLRPDSTIPAARLYAEHMDGQRDGGRIAKMFYAQNVFRFTDDGADREEAQCGVELIGAAGPQCDVELTQLALSVLDSIGLKGELHLSHTGIARAVMAAAGLSPEEQSVAYDRLLDGDFAVIDEVEARLPALNAPLRMLFEVSGHSAAFVTNLRETVGAAIPGLAAPLEELRVIVDAVQQLGHEPRIDALLARNFEYYTGVVFKIFVEGERVITGGRYDGLLELVSGRATPASGFGLYVRNAATLLTSKAQGAAPIVIVSTSDTAGRALADAYSLADELRKSGWRVATIDDEQLTATARVIVSASAPAYAVTIDGATTTHEDTAAVLRAVGAPR
jgi:histidyl-tRNA synthetase